MIYIITVSGYLENGGLSVNLGNAFRDIQQAKIAIDDIIETYKELGYRVVGKEETRDYLCVTLKKRKNIRNLEIHTRELL